MADEYLLSVTAGSSYDPSSHQQVPVNSPTPISISSPHADISLVVRIQNYRGLPPTSPHSSPYFSSSPDSPDHTHDQYSISFSFTPHRTIPGPSLLFGNDFDTPVRDRLPPGFNTALRIVRWAIDPGLEGDVYADKPYLYGPVLSSMNIIRVGGKPDAPPEEKKEKQVEAPAGAQDKTDNISLGPPGISEGGQSGGEQLRHDAGMPATPTARKAWGLQQHANRAESSSTTTTSTSSTSTWQWQSNRQYAFDFFNPYLDFNNFALKLPGFSLKFAGYLGGEDALRYTLKDGETGDVLMCVVFRLLRKEAMEAALVREVEGRHEGVVVEKEEEGKGEKGDEDEGMTGGQVETSADDVD